MEFFPYPFDIFNTTRKCVPVCHAYCHAFLSHSAVQFREALK